MAWRSACGKLPRRAAPLRQPFTMAEVVEVLRRCAGSATFAQLRHLNSGRAIRTALTAGQIERVAKGVYALPPAADPLAAARAQGGLVSHQSAALLHGFEVLV